MTESASTATVAHEAHHEELGFWSTYIFPTDHKMIGKQYLFTGMIMALIGGFMAYAFRMQLAFHGFVEPHFLNVTVSTY